MIACPEHGILAGRARQADIPMVPIEKGGALDLAAIRKLAAHLRRGEIDLIHSHNGRTAFIAAMAVLTAGRGHTVATQHFTSPARVGRHGLKGWLGRLLHTWVARHTDHTVAISEVVRQAILSRRESTPETVTMVWNGISDPAVRSLQDSTTVRKTLQVPAKAPLIVSAARLEPEKAVHVLVDAMAQLLPAFPHAVCLVAGEGHQRAALEAQIERLGLRDSVRLIGYQSDVHSIVRAADVFVLPSPAEPFGLALVEAMALGKPVVATMAGGPSEIVQDGESGLLASPDNAASLSVAIGRLLSDTAFSQAIGRRGRERFLRHFTARRMARDMNTIYRQTLDHVAARTHVGQNPIPGADKAPTLTSGMRT